MSKTHEDSIYSYKESKTVPNDSLSSSAGVSSVENEINCLVKKWIEAGWINPTLPELFVIGTGIKELVLKHR